MYREPLFEYQLWHCFGVLCRHEWTRSVVSRAGWSEFGVATCPEGRAAAAVSAAQRSTTSRVQRLSYNLGPPPSLVETVCHKSRESVRGICRSGSQLGRPPEQVRGNRVCTLWSGPNPARYRFGNE